MLSENIIPFEIITWS